MHDQSPKIRGWRKPLITALKLTALLVVFWFVGKALYRAIQLVDWTTVDFRALPLVSGALVFLGTCAAGSLAYKLAYRGLGSDLSWTQSFVLLTLPPAGKYLPSKVVAVAGHAAIAKTFGVRLKTSGAGAMLIMGLGLASAILLGILLLMVTPDAGRDVETVHLGLATGILLVMLIALHPGIFWRAFNLILHLLKQSPIEATMGLGKISVLFFILMLHNGLYISGVSIMAFGFVAVPVPVLPMVIGACCLANVAGFLALFAPAGLGVREGVLLVMLTPALDVGTAGLLVVVIRLVQTAADLILAGAGFVTLRVRAKINSHSWREP
ncbi:MAG: flippase-like domain-containing protein [Deltaproteobacteria bacterium]|nr:flippase-like domain-containing protein [Deltaproteobacteria bacterium]